ncbi:hypothetical protein IWW39_003430 [Coemansia spiralis]|uniref:PH domain-containing protein n=1 Tax=Coemansia spiralis TaxID=417178 RepID=A0A9W8GLI3_9FUNG|nr:hypothetical protein IWW39_003430 [Coemansia spiralis]
MDYQQQLELELNHQQQQFQQQFLQQYHQVQQLSADQHEWVHDGFVSPHTAAGHQYAMGFHSTPHNPNLPHHYAQNAITPAPPQSDSASQAPSVASMPRRRNPHAAARPWVKGSDHQQQQRRLSVGSGAIAASTPDEAEASDSSSSSGSNSSDESAYNYGGNTHPDKAESVSLASVSRSVSSSRPPQPQAKTRYPAQNTSALAPNGSAASSGAVPHSQPSDSEDDDDDDDDVPLSIISSSSTQNSDALAAVRRTKSAAPSAFSPRSNAAKLLQHSATVARHSPKSRSISTRPSVAHSPEISRAKFPTLSKGAATASPRNSEKAPLSRGSSSNSSDDEDAPLDLLQAELQAEFKPVRGGNGADAFHSDATTAANASADTASAYGQTADSAESDAAAAIAMPGPNAASFAKKGTHSVNKPKKLLHLLKASMPQSSRPGSSASSVGGKGSPASHVSSLPPVSVDEDADSGATSDAASNVSRGVSRGSSSLRSAKAPSPPPLPSAATKEKRTADYLPSGTLLPAVPMTKRKTNKARAGVQYVPLADIVENTERALLQQEMAAAADNDLAAEGNALQRNKSLRVGHGAFDADVDEPNSDARSLASHATGSSSGGTLMETLRSGHVELLTASTDHSGSKAVVERVVPEDYGDLDQLLVDLDGIMSGSQAARRRFSLVLMRRSLALSNGLVEPTDFSAQPTTGEADDRGLHHRTAIEFKPLEIPQAVSAAEGGDFGGGLGLDDIILSTIDGGDADPSSLQLGASAQHEPERPLSFTPQQPAELTRGQKVQRALEKLELLNFRKVSVRIYVQDARRYYSFILTEDTTCEMILNDMKKSGIIDPDKTTWALFELVHYFGIERPLNHFENIMNVVESWEPRSNNYIIVKAFSHQSSLTLLGGVQQGDHAIQGMLYFRLKKSKWQKGIFRLQGHNMVLVKDGRGKSAKEAHYLTLTNCDVYTPFEPLRGAPTRFVFGLKSEMPMQMFEKPDEDYVKWFAVPSLDSLREWLLVLRLAKNQIKFCKVLERRAVETGAVNDSEKPAALKPLVDLAAERHADDANDGAKKNSDFAAELVTSINKIASHSRYDPSALVKAMEQGGVDVSDFKVLGSGSGANPDDVNTDEAAQAANNLFQPGSLLSKPKRTAAEIEAAKPQDGDMFVKGSLLSQPRESKAMAASRAIQSIMAQDGNVFTHGSLLQVSEQPKARPPHVGGAANLAHLQFPLVQPDDPNLEFGIHSLSISNGAHKRHPEYMAPGAPYLVSQIAVPKGEPPVPVFGGLLASAQAQPPQQRGGLNNGYAHQY